MQKTIIKTIIITVVAFIGALAIAFGILSLCCPNFIADVADTLGANSICTYYREKQFEKSGEFDDLKKLVISLDADENSRLTSIYSFELIEENRVEFNDYCKQDGKKEFGSEKNAKEYFFDKYIISEYNQGRIDNALNLAVKCVMTEGCGYTASNPFRSLIYGKAEELSEQDIYSIRSKLVLSLYSLSNEENVRRQQDITQLDELKAQKQQQTQD